LTQEIGSTYFLGYGKQKSEFFTPAGRKEDTLGISEKEERKLSS